MQKIRNQYQHSQMNNANNHNLNHSQNNNILQYINLLDKCTQILREDRIWFRNQLKANHQEVIQIFKNTKKPINMQHLQIKLRKYITSIKSKTKMDQLIKFKQNLLNTCTLTNLNPSQNQSFNQTLNVQKFMDENSRSNPRPNKSPLNNSKSPSFQNTRNLTTNSLSKLGTYSGYQQISYKEMKQRQTWKNRSTNNNNNNNNLQSNNKFNNNLTKSNQSYGAYESNNDFPFHDDTNNYDKRIKQHNSYSKFALQDKNQNKSKQKQYQTILQLSERQQMQSGRNYLKMNNFVQQKENQKNSFSNMKKNEQNHMQTYPNQNQEDYYNDGRQESQQEQNYIKKDKNLYLGEKKMNFDSASKFNKPTQNISNDFPYSDINMSNKNKSNDGYKHYQSYDNMLTLNNGSSTLNLNTKNDNLFTSPQLLNQCRRFIQQQKSASGNKTNNKQSNYISQNFESSHKFNIDKIQNNVNFGFNHLNLEDYSSKNINQYSMNQQLITNNKSNNPSQEKYDYNYDVYQPSSQTRTYQHQDKNNFLSNINNLANLKNEENYYNYQLSSQKHNLNQEENSMDKARHQFFSKIAHGNKSPDKQNVESDHISFREHQVFQNQYPQNLYVQQSQNEKENLQNIQFSIQSLMEELIPYFNDKKILEEDFLNVVPSQVGRQVRKYLSKKLNGYISVVDVGKMLQSLSFVKGRQQSRNPVDQINSLLDIDQKGYISVQDVQNFIGQLQDAQIQCLQQIGQKLWRLFDMSQVQGKVQYWSLYILKDKQQFKNVCEVLQQFEFEIQL